MKLAKQVMQLGAALHINALCCKRGDWLPPHGGRWTSSTIAPPGLRSGGVCSFSSWVFQLTGKLLFSLYPLTDYWLNSFLTKYVRKCIRKRWQIQFLTFHSVWKWLKTVSSISRHFKKNPYCEKIFVFKTEKSQLFENYSKSGIWILAFSTNFFPIKTDLSGNTVWSQASGFQKLAKMDHFWHF